MGAMQMISRARHAVLAGWMATAMLLAVSPERVDAQQRFRLEEGQWQAQEVPDPDTPEGRLLAIRQLIAQEQGKQARQAASAWIEQYPNHPLLVEAHLLRGDAYVAQDNLYQALFDYEWVIRNYPASEQFFTALEREYDIAMLFSQGKKRRVMGFIWITAYGEAAELFIRIQERAPGSDLGERASIALANHYFRRGDMLDAAEAYDLFLLNYPNSTQREWAMLRLIQSNLATFKGPEFDPTGLIDAAARLRQYRQEYPAAAERIGAESLLVRIEESMALKDYRIGQWYERRGERVSAAYMYRRLVEQRPQTAAAEVALRRLQQLDVPTLRMAPVDEPAPDRRPDEADADAPRPEAEVTP